MVYLDPGQESLVERSLAGPARIRGAAGTGKTVVALHRARRMARAGRRVLFTTYVRSLPEIYQEVFARFAPAERGLVEFANVHRWATGFLHRNGVHLRVDLRGVDTAFRYEERDHGEFRTRRLVLERYDAMAGAARTGHPYQTVVDPPPGHGPRHARG